MLYYRYRPASELSLKELLYNEIYFGSTSENNDPYDGKTFYYFGSEQDKWFRLLECAWKPITHIDWTEWAKSLSSILSENSPMTFQEALSFDYIGALHQVPDPPNALDAVGLTALVKRFIDLYRPEDSHFASFSKSCDNHLMWAHYASRYQGYCLIFKPIDGKLRQAAQDMRGSVHRLTPKGIGPHMSLQMPESFVFQDVVYSDKPVFGDAFMRFPQHVSNLLLDEPGRIELIDSQERQYLEKHQSWSYEQEVRLLLKAPLAWLFGEHISFTKHERLFHYQPTQLVGIITGPLMREEYKQQIYEIIRDRVSRHSYTGDGVKTEVFDFVFFEAELENNDRHIEVTPTKILSLSQETNRGDNGFDEKYRDWLDGWAMVFEGAKALREQIS